MAMEDKSSLAINSQKKKRNLFMTEGLWRLEDPGIVRDNSFYVTQDGPTIHENGAIISFTSCCCFADINSELCFLGQNCRFQWNVFRIPLFLGEKSDGGVICTGT